MRAVAVNVGANTTLPGVRGPIYPDGSFLYLPIPEREPTAEPVPTYADLLAALDRSVEVPDPDREVHLDPTFAGYPHCDAYTYGDPHAVKAGPLAELSAGDYALFYATLSTRAADGAGDDRNGSGAGSTPETGVDDRADWIAPEWGAYLIGVFRLARDPVTGDGYRDLPPAERARFAGNAHVKRESFDAEVLLAGDPDGSRLLDRAVPLSTPTAGADANRLVTDLSDDSGNGPWWRRPLRFDAAATPRLLDVVEDGEYGRCFE